MPGPTATRLNNGGRHTPNSWRTSHARAWRDLRARWRRGLLWTLYLGIVLGLGFSLWVTLALAKSNTRSLETACIPDGRFTLKPSEYNYWAAQGFFDITMGFGDLTFTQAKVIDVVWDVVVGRGGQALLAWISWTVFAKYVATTMRVAPITFDTFRTFFLYRETTTAFSVTRLVRDFSRRHSLPSRCAMIYMITTMMFILAFPTFGSAMTGYKANVEAFIKDSTGSYVPFTKFTFLYYTIHDGDRINLTSNFRITDLGGPEERLRPLDFINNDGWPLMYGGTYCRGSTSMDKPCGLAQEIDDYVIKYGVEGATNTVTSFGLNQTSLEAPSLNITAHYIPWLDKYTEVRGPSGSSIDITDYSRLAWSNGNGSAYLQAYIEQFGSCQPTQTYQWGFSFIQLILMIALLLAWATGLYILYICSHVALLNSTREEDEKAPGDYTAILHLAKAINDQAGHGNGDENTKSEPRVLSEKELRQHIDKDLKGGTISYKDSLLDNAETRSRAARPWKWMNWLQKEMGWVLLLLLAIVGAFLVTGFFPYLAIIYLAPLAVLFAWYVGQTGKTRAVLLFWPMLVLGGVPTAVLVSLIFTRYTGPR